MSLHVEQVQIENLRGYTRCTMALKRPKTVLVGPNNSGKTSILRIVDWFLNHAPDPVLDDSENPSPEIIQFLVPARGSKNRARRLTLWVRVTDGRSQRRFECLNGLAQLRLNLRQTPEWKIYVALGEPRRGESPRSDKRALELLDRLRNESAFVYIPSFRDGHSSRFRATLLDAFRSRLSGRALHAAQGGAPSEYRRVRGALTDIRQVAEDLALPLWDEMRQHLPPGLARSARVSLKTKPKDLVEWLTSQLTLRISTGAHDEETVHIADLGSGLQSLLDLAVIRSERVNEDLHCTLVIEEPESFLHPSAQRTLARSLLGDSTVDRVIVTTHSPVIVEEASYSAILLCRDQRFFEPAELGDATREEINATLLTGYGAEMVFARSVLFVEGEGDRLFFERMRRRIAALDHSGRTDELFVVPVGGKKRFGPWIRFLESYVERGEKPIRWLVAADGDAAPQVRQAFADATVAVSADIVHAVERAGAEMANGVEPWRRSLTALNRTTRKNNVSFSVVPVDLEDAALAEASNKTLRTVAKKVGSTDFSREGLLRFFGSKAVTPHQEKMKQPWMRRVIAEALPSAELSNDIRRIILRWLEGAMPRSSATALLRRFTEGGVQ